MSAATGEGTGLSGFGLVLFYSPASLLILSFCGQLIIHDIVSMMAFLFKSKRHQQQNSGPSTSKNAPPPHPPPPDSTQQHNAPPNTPPSSGKDRDAGHAQAPTPGSFSSTPMNSMPGSAGSQDHPRMRQRTDSEAQVRCYSRSPCLPSCIHN